MAPRTFVLIALTLGGCWPQAGFITGGGSDDEEGVDAGPGPVEPPPPPPEEPPPPPPPPVPPQDGHDGLSHNGLSQNRLSLNRLSLNQLSADRITLTNSGLEATPEGRELLTYVVRCALPEGESLSASYNQITYVFPGLLGLAPEWMDGACDQSCRRWVSACLLAHVNAIGVSVPISLRAADGRIPTTEEERELFWVQEGAYFGDVFAEVPEGTTLDKMPLHSCRGEAYVITEFDDDPLSWLSKRLCADWGGGGCGFKCRGMCSDFQWPEKICEDYDESDGTFSDCTGLGGATYDEVITVYLRQ